MRKTITNICENDLWFRIAYLALVTLSFNSLFAYTMGLYAASYALAFLGACILLYRVIHFRKYTAARGVWLLVLFTVSYCISSLLTREYGLTENIQALVWMALQLFILYVYNQDRPVEKDRRDVRIICWIFVVYNFIVAIAAMVLFFENYSSFFSRRGTYANIGIWFNRLLGLYSEVNTGAVASLASLLMAGGLWKGTKKALRPFLALQIVLQLIYISLSYSRTALLAMAAAFAAAVFLLYIRAGKPAAKPVWRYMLAIVLAAIVAAGSVGVVKGIQSAGKQIQVIQAAAEKKEQTNKNKDDAEGTKDKDTASTNNAGKSTEIILGREADNLDEDVSNGRFDIWKSGIELWRTSPIFGISFRNYIAYAEDNLPETYIVNNKGDDFAALHNVLLDVLLSQGIVGIVLFLSFIISVFTAFFKGYFKAKDDDYYYYTFLVVCLFALAVSSLFVTNILYVNSPVTVVFWLFLGYLAHAVTLPKAEPLQMALEEG